MSKCAVCGRVEKPGDYSRVWVYLGKRVYCEEHVPSVRTLKKHRRKLRDEAIVLRAARTSAKQTLGNATSAATKLPKDGAAARRQLPKAKLAGDLDVPRMSTLRLELVQCGKSTCKKPHGPYWYAYWKEGGRTRKRYIGKRLPHALAEARQRAMEKRPRWLRAAADERVLEELELGGDE